MTKLQITENNGKTGEKSTEDLCDLLLSLKIDKLKSKGPVSLIIIRPVYIFKHDCYDTNAVSKAYIVSVAYNST